MAETSDVLFTRRSILGGIAALAATPAFAAQPKVVTMLGDSITAGYGLPAGLALPTQLQAELARLGKRVQIRNAGVSGDTTADALRRLDFSVRPGTSVCVVALGGNDLLEGLEPTLVRANLEKIVRRLQARGITVVLAGMRAPVALGGAYAREFNAAFDAVARMRGVISYPDLLAGVEGNRALNQRDGIHPNAAGVKIIARRLAPVVAKALALRR
ncbi:MAG: arylesterase [Parcubacteria group bacterium]